MLEAYPYWTQGVIPKGTYKAAKEDIHVISLWNFAVAHKDSPKDLVYDMTKATFEVLPQLANAVKDMAKTKPEDILYSSVPLHKGAIKYYREIGLTIPDKLIPAEAK
ncbi:MAG: TAXI family TRAP transporter solute-binding subunit [Bilophila wadsworthia]|uniref:TAXI family TRAP transporter solute-binding subunit n=1 Tax=Bilophila wadsworthia TaxID=35833 RepID=UPI00300EC635